MRAAGLADLDACAGALMAVPPRARPALMAALIVQAQAADAHRAATGRAHPRWGNGTLAAVAMARPRAPWPMGCRDGLAALALAAQAVAQVAGGGCQTAPMELSSPLSPCCEAAMPQTYAQIARLDPVWDRICQEAQRAVADEPLLGGVMHTSLLHHPTMERALAYRFAQKLASPELSEQILRELADEAYAADSWLGEAARADLVATYDRDPACHRFLQPILYFKGFQAVQAYRIAHWLWGRGRIDMAAFVQMRVSEAFGVDIHPGARIGKGIMIDHAHSIVIGETAVVGDNVSMLHSVTLGGTGKEDGDRHPKIGNGVLIGAGAKVLGNISIGHCTRIAAGSVVLSDVPPCKTVAGVPARIVGEAGCAEPALSMDHRISEGALPG